MLRDEWVSIDEVAPTWAPDEGAQRTEAWRDVDRQLRSIAKRRAALDADEARWLREAEALKIWIPLGMVNALDYMERVLGYGPRAAQDRLRVARALGGLPELTNSLATGELPFSAVRELTRIATPATERAWARAASGKNLRQIEELVAGHKPGDMPDDPPDPEIRMHVVRWELAPETYALLRQAKAALDSEHGTNLDDNAFAAALAGSVLDPLSSSEPAGRARYQIAVTICERCRQGWQEGAGAKVAIDSAAVERAECDAQYIGSLDADEPERAHQDIPPAVARLIWRRDGGRCRVPGCRSARGLEIHHIVHRAHGGTHDASNCIVVCSACHGHHHAGRLAISGTADRLEVRRVAESRDRDHRAIDLGNGHESSAPDTNERATMPSRAHVGASPRSGAEPDAKRHPDADTGTAVDAHVGASSRLDAATKLAQARDALVNLGWKPAIARTAVDAAIAALGSGAPLEDVVFEALRRCPKPLVRGS